MGCIVYPNLQCKNRGPVVDVTVAGSTLKRCERVFSAYITRLAIPSFYLDLIAFLLLLTLTQLLLLTLLTGL
jgi:hypothetical protein